MTPREKQINSSSALDFVLKDGGITTFDVTNNAALQDVTLNVTLDAGFTPVAGDYTLISAGSLSGTIGTVNLPSDDWSLSYPGNDVVLTYTPASPLAITAIDYGPDADADADADTVTLTWRSRPGTTYKAFASLDLSDWSHELADSLGPETEGIIVDGELLTMTFPLENGLENEFDLFFRIQEE